jgi:hypothetical protein
MLRNGKVSLRSGLEAPSKAKAMRRLKTLRNGEEMRCDESEKHSVDRLWISGEWTCIGEAQERTGKALICTAVEKPRDARHWNSTGLRRIEAARRGVDTLSGSKKQHKTTNKQQKQEVTTHEKIEGRGHNI